MGILKSLFKEIMKAAEEAKFTPDFSKTEYDNWLDYLSKGGTSEEWKALKKQNGWKFKRDPVVTFEKYQKEVTPFSNSYYAYLALIEKNWSTMYRSKNYTGKMAVKIENDCYTAIDYYKKMKAVDEKYGEETPTNIPPFKRLAMLYERQNRYEDCVSICKEAYQYGMDETGRMKIAIKKAGRTPTAEEAALIDK